MGRTARVGLLVATAIAIFMVTVFSLGRQEHLFDRKVEYELHLSRINGLQDGAPVTLNGVPVGTVSQLRFPTDLGSNYIELTIRVAANVAPRIREDTLASVRTYGLLGDRYIELSPGSPAAKELPPGGVIASIDPVDYEAVLGQSGDIVQNVVEVTASLKDVLQTIQRGEGLLGAMVRNREFGETTLRDLEGTLKNVRATSGRLDQILERVDRGEGLVGRLTRDTAESRAIVGGLQRSVANLDALTTRLRNGRGAAVRLVEDQAYGDRLLEKLDHTLTELEAVATKLNSREGTLGRLVNDPSLYDDAKGLVGTVRESWLLQLYRGVSGLWPFGRGSEPPETTP